MTGVSPTTSPPTVGTPLRVWIATAAPRVSRGLKVLSPAPYVLKSYVNWRLPKEKRGLVTFGISLFGPDDTPEAMAADLLAQSPDVIAFSVYVWNQRETFLCARLIKQSHPAITLIMGGPQVSPIAESLLDQQDFIDIIPYVTAPGETIFFHLIMALIHQTPLNDVAGLAYRNGQGAVEKSSGMVEALALTDIPSPFLDGTITFDDQTDHTVILETARGCPFDCGYCFWGSGGREMDYFPRQRVEQEIDLLYSEPRVKHVYFSDSDFLIRRQRAEWMIDRLIAKGADTASSFELDARNITQAKRSIIEKLAQLPDFQFVFAIQTTNPEALSAIGVTRPKPEVYTQRLKLLRGWMEDVQVVVDVMLPLPKDTPEGFRATLNDVLTLRPTRLVLNYPVFLLPGTRFYEEQRALGLICLPEPPHPVVETKSFPKQAVNTAFQWGIWAEILTYYHPAVGDFFHALTLKNPDQPPIERLERWVGAIREKWDLMAGCGGLVDFAVTSVENLNAIKGALLSQACEPKNSLLIYQTLLMLEQANCDKDTLQPIQRGVELFQATLDAELDWLDAETLKSLPLRYGPEEAGVLARIPPRFRRHADAIAAQKRAWETLHGGSVRL
ncbi:MAG: radical SAM protein [Magnetococcales bacterium]|nr:radical SAM protein [Magnetococcales bacterium]